MEREQVAWKKSKSSGTRASRVGHVASRVGRERSRVGHVAWDEWPSRPR